MMDASIAAHWPIWRPRSSECVQRRRAAKNTKSGSASRKRLYDAHEAEGRRSVLSRRRASEFGFAILRRLRSRLKIGRRIDVDWRSVPHDRILLVSSLRSNLSGDARAPTGICPRSLRLFTVQRDRGRPFLFSRLAIRFTGAVLGSRPATPPLAPNPPRWRAQSRQLAPGWIILHSAI